MRALRLSQRFLAIAAFVGWLLFAFVAVRVAPGAIGSPDNQMMATAQGFVRARVDAARDGGNWDRVLGLTTDDARSAIETQAAGNPGALPDLALSGEPLSRLIWSADGRAMVEVSFATSREGASTELLLMRFDGGSWLVSDLWRVLPDPEIPVVPAE